MENGLIHSAMLAIMRDVPVIGKDSRNNSQGYAFRGIDAVYNELHSIMANHRVYTTSEVLSEHHEERQTTKGGTLLYRVYRIAYTFHAEDGSCVTSTVIGEGMDSGDKASNKAMAIAHKYALLQAFMVPTMDMVDPDAESHEVAPKSTANGMSAGCKMVLDEMRRAQTVAELTKSGRRGETLSQAEQAIIRAEYATLKDKLNNGGAA